MQIQGATKKNYEAHVIFNGSLKGKFIVEGHDSLTARKELFSRLNKVMIDTPIEYAIGDLRKLV